MVFNTGLTHLGSEASNSGKIWISIKLNIRINGGNLKCKLGVFSLVELLTRVLIFLAFDWLTI